MWKVDVSATAHTTSETIWAWYEATDLAPTWDPLVQKIEADGPIEVGVRGRNFSKGAPPARFVYTEVTRLVSYTEVTSAPGATFAFTHSLVQLPESRVTVTHGAEVGGALAGLYGLVMRRRFEKGMREALDNLIVRVETGPPPEQS